MLPPKTPMPGIEVRTRERGWSSSILTGVFADRFPLQKDFFQGVCELRQDDLGGLAAGHRHRLSFQCGEDLGGEAGSYGVRA